MAESTLHFSDFNLSSQMDTVGFEHYSPTALNQEISDLDFEFGALIGEGGMAEVYTAQQSEPSRNVAIKVPKDHAPGHIRLMLKEAHLTGRLEHPNIVPIYLLRRTITNEVEIVMRKIEGRSMLESIDSRDDLNELLHALVQVCRALEYAHSKGVIHRDIKPSNIMMGQFGEVYLMDWGIAFDSKSSQRQMDLVVGTPAYMAPEMLDLNTNSSPSCDIYLLGSTLHHILAGNPRHNGQNVKENMALAEQSEPYDYPASVPQYLGELANRTCHQLIDARPDSVATFRKELEAYFNLQEAENYISAGQELLADLRTIGTNVHQNQLALSDYHKALFAFEQARNFPSHRALADQGLIETNETMLSISIEHKEMQVAKVIYETCTTITPELEDKYQALKDEINTKKLAYQKLHKAYDQTHIRQEKFWLSQLMLIVVMVLITGVTIYDFLYAPEITGLRLLVTMTILSGSINLFIFANRDLRFNAHHRRLQTTLGFGSFLLVVYSAVGAYLDMDGDLIMLGFLGIVGLAFTNTYPFLKYGYLIGIFCLVSIVASCFNPELTHSLFKLSGLFATILFFFQNRREDYLNRPQSKP